MKAGGTTVAKVSDFEGVTLTPGPGCIATIRPKAPYGPARYVVTVCEAAGALWNPIFQERAHLAYKIINQSV